MNLKKLNILLLLIMCCGQSSYLYSHGECKDGHGILTRWTYHQPEMTMPMFLRQCADAASSQGYASWHAYNTPDYPMVGETHFVCLAYHCANCAYGEHYNPRIKRCMAPPMNSCANPKAGNPVEIATGRKHQIFQDYQSGSLTFNRTVYQNGSGAAWSFSFQEFAAVLVLEDVDYVYLSDGVRNEYLIKESESCWRHSAGECMQIDVVADGLEITGSVSVRKFDKHGRLTEAGKIGDPLSKVIYTYSDGSVTLSSRGKTIAVYFDSESRVDRLVTPAGDITYSYSEKSGLLERVTFPDQSFQQYVYSDSDPYFLRELKHGDQTFAYWDYDSSNRVVRSWHAGEFDSFTFQYSPDEVLVTNPLGKQTRYVFETVDNVRLVKEVQGHPSPNCAAANKSYDYYDNGTLKSKTDWEGNVTTYLRDDLGREISRTEAAGTPDARTITTEYHSEFNKPVKITEPGLITEMTYDSAGRLLNTKKTSTTVQ